MSTPDTNKAIHTLPDEVLMNCIYVFRNQKVMLDSDLANLYEVQTFRLNEQVKRNLNRFPDDFMFQLNQGEWDSLVSQIAIPKKGTKMEGNLW